MYMYMYTYSRYNTHLYRYRSKDHVTRQELSGTCGRLLKVQAVKGPFIRP